MQFFSPDLEAPALLRGFADRFRRRLGEGRSEREDRIEADRERASRSFLDFVEMFWHVLEPPSRAFVRGWAIEAIAEHLQAVLDGQIRRLLINCPPGFSKSMLTSALLCAYEWGPIGRPERRYICTSYAEELSIRDNRRCRKVLRSAGYRELWPRVSMVPDQDQRKRFENTASGWKLATSVGGLGTGERGDIVIVDDPHPVRGAESAVKRKETRLWFTEVLPTRVNDAETAPFVVIMQRVHEQDISGLILAKDLGYDHLCLPQRYERSHPFPSKTSLRFVDPRTEPDELLDPVRFPLHVVEEQEKVLSSDGGGYAVAGQFQQRPTPREGGLFHLEDFQPLRNRREFVPIARCRGWDLAASDSSDADWTAGVRIALGYLQGIKVVVVEHVLRRRLRSGGVAALIAATAEQDGADVPISIPQDPGQAGKAQVSYLAGQLHGFNCHFSAETGEKSVRAGPLAYQGEAGNLYYLPGEWAETFIAEATRFPSGYKDQVDAASRAYAYLLEYASDLPEIGAPEAIEGE